jgi:hypothetical protein
MPIGSRPPRYCLANASLTMHTGTPSPVSASVNARPFTIGISSVSKYVGLTM